ncbi:MAG: FliO/MopB family protein [Candidatus Nitrohelix vancouverensis]|uniref:FliO/MopB family protein n=1 Tax=Candidatus Nitrohelix vancouverensis TaxID=2705534 RepID=A0A7T0C2S7_9BACT|nr:MAG: FliO/MopB family protein [Candidatus Nitrohelix vancouverensis]
MNVLRQMIAWTLPLILFIPASSHAMADLSSLNRLNDVSVVRGEDAMVVHLEFKNPVKEFGKTVYYQKSAQFDLPGAYIDPPKQYISTQDSHIPQIYLAQYDSETVRVRFIFDENSDSPSGGFDLTPRGNSLKVHIQKKETDFLSRLLAQTAESVEAAELESAASTAKEASAPVPAQKEVVVYSETDKDVVPATPALKSSIASRSSKQEPTGLKAVGMTGKSEGFATAPSAFKMAGMLVCVVGFMLILFYIFKKYILKNTPFGGGEKVVKVLGTGFLGPRKHIALVEVAGQVLALGISRDNISFLTQIDDAEQIEKLKSSGADPLTESLTRRFQKKKVAAPATERARKAESAPEPASAFNKYMKEFDEPASDKQESVANVTAQIRRRMGKVGIA